MYLTPGNRLGNHQNLRLNQTNSTKPLLYSEKRFFRGALILRAGLLPSKAVLLSCFTFCKDPLQLLPR